MGNGCGALVGSFEAQHSLGSLKCRLGRVVERESTGLAIWARSSAARELRIGKYIYVGSLLYCMLA